RSRAAGPWSKEQAAPILEQTLTLRLAFDRTRLTAGEQAALAPLLEAGQVMQDVYEASRHHQALSARAGLERLPAPEPRESLRTLYRLFQGPIVTTLTNEREPFLAVDAVVPGKNVYPWGVKKEELEAWLSTHPEEREYVLAPRTVVRRDTEAARAADRQALARHPVLDGLHPMLRQRLSRPPVAGGFYSIPYALAYADEMVKAHGLLTQAARAVRGDDPELAGYLRNRARDLLSNDYESGDASWVTGQFKNLNAQIGSYETYDDELYGVKTFFSFCLFLTRQSETTALRQAMKGLQALEDSLPYNNHKKVREDIPVGVYDVVADFGQSRGGNTATILPNESYLARRYGRTILLRANIMRDPNIFEGTSKTFAAAVGEQQAKELTSDGNFYRTLWHEVGHYLGVDRTKDGRDLDEALQDNSNTLEEMKADLVSLFVAE